MKILHLTLDFGDGGAEKFIVYLSNKQEIEGNDVSVCSFWDIRPKDYFQNQLNPQIKFHTLNKRRGLDIRIFYKLYHLLKKCDPDVIHTHRTTLNYLLPLLLLKKRKVIHTIHNDAFKETKQYFLRKIKAFFFNLKIVTPVTISNESRESFRQAYNLDSRIIFNGIPHITKTTEISIVSNYIKKIKPTPDTQVILNIGRFSHQKNQKLLIQVINQLISEGWDLLLIMIGRDIEHFWELQNYQNDRIHFLGSKDNATDYLFFSDAFCLSSIYEGMPISLIEAFATQCIPIVTPAGGMKDMIKNKNNGYIASSISFDGLYEAFRLFLLDSNNIKNEIKRNCLVEFSNIYHIDIVYNNYMTLYNEK